MELGDDTRTFYWNNWLILKNENVACTERENTIELIPILSKYRSTVNVRANSTYHMTCQHRHVYSSHYSTYQDNSPAHS